MVNAADFRVPTVEEIREARKKRIVAVMLSVFGDECHDEREQVVFAVAGIMGTQEEWDNFEPEWLKATGGRVFHAADCESGYDDFAGIPKEERHALYKAVTQLLANSRFLGFSVSIDIQAYKDLIQHRLEGVSHYLHCFIPVVLKFARVAPLYFPVEKKVKFAFDRNQKTNFASFRIVDYLKSLSEQDFSSYIGDFKFVSRENVGIQAADLLARESMKDLTNHLSGNRRNRRKSMQTLLKSGRFEFRYWDRLSFEQHEQEIYNLQRLEQLDNIRWEDYQQWLSDHGCLDNAPTRTDYMFYRRKSRTRL